MFVMSLFNVKLTGNKHHYKEFVCEQNIFGM